MKKLIITVEHHERVGWCDTSYQIFGRFYKFRKWWKFWENKYEEIPLNIINLESEDEL